MIPGSLSRTAKGIYEQMVNMLNALTVDVEDYFHVSAFKNVIDRKDWGLHPLRVERNTGTVLDLFDEYSVKGTFFFLGWVAERCRGLVKEIQARGHEVGCHGHGHQPIYTIGPEAFREDVRRAKRLLEDICGARVMGYRAPSFSITNESMWALDILIEEGFLYDSSIFPIYHDAYGVPDADPYPHEIKRSGGAIIEFPLSTLAIRFLNREVVRIPVSGGGYLRAFPLCFLKKAIAHINMNLGKPAVLYFHPWEMDPDQPRIKAGLKSTFRHYHNLRKTEAKIRAMLSSFRFAPMMDVLKIPYVTCQRTGG
jgi:polysaccharide deacetylase family protein (PEP-CTERM system associated)